MGTSKALRIAIIGAGPSGLSLAWYFKQLGFRSVEIFEATNDVGGQSHTVDVGGIPIEMGTCYLTDGYVIAREIARAAGAPAARLPRSTFLDQQGQVVVPAQPAALDTVHYIMEVAGLVLCRATLEPRTAG